MGKLEKTYDQAAFAELMRTYQQMVFSIVLQVVRNREVAEEVSQDVFVKIYYALPKFDQRSKISTWMYRIAYNTAISTKRKMRELTVSTDCVSQGFLQQPDEGYDLEKEERLQRLSDSMETLKPEDSVILTLYYYEKHSVEEIAQVTQLSTSNVKVRLHRLRKKIYDTLNTSGYGSNE